MIDSVKSDAVVMYTSRGRSPFPWGDPAAVRALGAGEELLRHIEGLVEEMYEAFPLATRDPDLSNATETVERGMAVRHPELDSRAVEALAWMWSYSAWK
ncbi:hypothetical protein ACFFWC_18605 [Plantactinospora siamensis]|uniref:Uncharacterized protein n=1 Tax=Plantactinospora siamensis TaxID=555372 RepID=A0ABV6P344_9ACTN